jgi:hypothetical protein
LVQPGSSVLVPLDDGVCVIRLLHYAEFTVRLSEVAQPLDAITGSQFLLSDKTIAKRWPLGTI